MMEAAVGTVIKAIGIYATFGLVFGVWFVTSGHRRLDNSTMTVAARVLLLPAAALLWPLLIAKWWRAVEEEER